MARQTPAHPIGSVAARSSAVRPEGLRIAAPLAGWLAGIVADLQLATLWSAAAFVGCVLLGVALAAAGWRRGGLGFVSPPLGAFASALGAALLAFGVAGLEARAVADDRLSPALEGRDLEVVGIVAGLPQRGPDGLRFAFDVESARLDGTPVRIPAALALRWHAGRREPAGGASPRDALRAGQRWHWTLRLRRPHGTLNPHGYDRELQLFEQGQGATGYVREAPAPRRLDAAAGHPVERLRQRVRDAIDARVPDRRVAGVLAALSIGDQSAIDHADWDLYRNTGVAHLVSISGLHITMFAWLAGGAVGRVWRRFPRAVLAWPAPLAARWGGVACAAGYALVSGWGVPSQRTVWMLVAVTLFQTWGVRWPWALVLMSAAVVITAIDPWALTQAGFWLSFGAVGLLMASSAVRAAVDEARPVGRRGKAWQQIRNDLRTQVIATVGLTPLTLVIFQQVSVVGFVANLVSIPLITLAITPLALLGIAAPPLWAIGAWLVRGLNHLLAALAAWPGAVWMVPVAPAWAQLAGLAGALLLVAPLPWRARALALPLLVPLLWPAPPLPPAGRYDLIALDIGQGTSVLIRTRGHALLFDTGPPYGTDSDAGQRVVLPLLRARGEARLDTLVLSHRDSDHVGGAASILAALPVGELLSSLEPTHPLHVGVAHDLRCEHGQRWEWDGVRFEVLRPTADDYGRTLASNAMSCVLRVDDGHRSVLLTGDIEREQEAALLGSVRERLRSDVLIVPHHGSKTSSAGAFLDAVAPRIAVFQAGYRNRFGHPAAEVMARYLERGIAPRTSPDCGAWLLEADGPDEGRCWRAATRRYWRFRPDAPDRVP